MINAESRILRQMIETIARRSSGLRVRDPHFFSTHGETAGLGARLAALPSQHTPSAEVQDPVTGVIDWSRLVL